jgi:hypothetical protein
MLIILIHFPGHETRVTPLKVNSKKQRSKILNQTNFEEWNWGENQSKKQCKIKKIAIKTIVTKFDIKIKWNQMFRDGIVKTNSLKK